jgi:macrolide transport system ATP-binding/permease protein
MTRWAYKLRLRLRSLFRRDRIEMELRDELRFHLGKLVEEKLAAGLNAEEARYAARRELGGVEQIKEECRDMRRLNLIENLVQDLRYGLRMLAKSPGLTAVVVLSLALGIGANTAIFSLIDAVLLKMLPVQNPQEIALLSWSSHGWAEGIMSNVAGDMDEDKAGRMSSPSFSYAVYDEIRAHSQAFSSVLALAGNDSQLNLGYQGEPGHADGELVSGTFFSTLGVEPILGRAITPDDDRFGASPMAVISYGYWQRRFGGDAGVVGRKITINAVPFTIAGVCPPELYGVQPGRSVEVWMPLHTQPQVETSWLNQGWNGAGVPPGNSLFTTRGNWWLVIMGRLKPGISFERARPELELLLQHGMAPDIKPSIKPETIPHMEVGPGSKGMNDLRDQFSKPLFILMTVVALVLLIACANVANMLLARAGTRQREIAVRLAIGAGRRRLIRQLLTENMLLAALGGALGLLLAFWGTRVLMAFMSSGRDPISLSVTPDLRVLGFTAAVSVLTGILFGLSPALRSTRVDLTPALKETGGGLSGAVQSRGRMRLGLGKTLVIIQVGLSLLLLVGAGLFVRTLTNLEHVNTGFDQHNLLLFGIDPTEDGYRNVRLAEFYQELTRRIAALPGVRSVSASHNTLVGGGGNDVMTHILGYTPKPDEKEGVQVGLNTVGPRFFETMRMPLVLGRSIGEGDTEAAPKVAVVNHTFARKYLGGSDPIGRQFTFGDPKTSPKLEIVGVVADVRFFDLREEIPPTIYVPYLQGVTRETAVLGELGPMHFEGAHRGRSADDGAGNPPHGPEYGPEPRLVRRSHSNRADRSNALSGALVRKAHRLLRDSGCAARLHWSVRHHGLRDHRSHARNRHPHDAGSEPRGDFEDGAARDIRAADRRNWSWNSGGSRDLATSLGAALRPEADGPPDPRRRCLVNARRRSARRLRARAPGGERGPNGGASIRVRPPAD